MPSFLNKESELIIELLLLFIYLENNPRNSTLSFGSLIFFIFISSNKFIKKINLFYNKILKNVTSYFELSIFQTKYQFIFYNFFQFFFGCFKF